MRHTILVALALLVLLAAPASAHLERSTEFPDPSRGSVPELRTSGPTLVVCASDTRQRVKSYPKRLKRRNLRLLKRCRFRSIQEAVNAAARRYRILILPGRYTEPASRSAPFDDPRCEADYETTHEDDPTVSPSHPSRVATFAHHLKCPNAKNLIAIIGDGDGDGRCDRLCDLQLEGTGRRPSDVTIVGDRKKLDVIRADRADGIVIANLAVEEAAFNGIDIVETNGYRVERIVARWNNAYGILSFTSDHGLYDRIHAHGNGDAGVYPGSSAEGGCERFSTEVREVDSHHNLSGYSGTAGNSVWVHDSRFHHNAVGISTDSAVPNHPGHPQDCARFERNDLYSNNYDLYDDEHDRYCAETSFEQRRKDVVCPQGPVAMGTGLAIYGGNRNGVVDNRIWDNWRDGIKLIYMPAPVRGEFDPAKLFDTSHENRFVGNVFATDAAGGRDPNGNDIFWDEQGRGNCFEGNTGFGAAPPRTSPSQLPSCPGSPVMLPGTNPPPGDPLCATWSRENPNPPGCPWVVLPDEPQ